MAGSLPLQISQFASIAFGFAHHHGFVPRLCQPYRPRTKGKVERFIRYLRASFYVPLASQLIPEGLKVDRDTANARVGTWLREVANARVHRDHRRSSRSATPV